MTTLFGIMPWFRRYDTHCYAHRYDRVQSAAEIVHPQLTTDKILRMSKDKVVTIDQKIDKENREKALDKLNALCYHYGDGNEGHSRNEKTRELV